MKKKIQFDAILREKIGKTSCLLMRDKIGFNFIYIDMYVKKQKCKKLVLN